MVAIKESFVQPVVQCLALHQAELSDSKTGYCSPRTQPLLGIRIALDQLHGYTENESTLRNREMNLANVIQEIMTVDSNQVSLLHFYAMQLE